MMIMRPKGFVDSNVLFADGNVLFADCNVEFADGNVVFADGNVPYVMVLIVMAGLSAAGADDDDVVMMIRIMMLVVEFLQVYLLKGFVDSLSFRVGRNSQRRTQLHKLVVVSPRYKG